MDATSPKNSHWRLSVPIMLSRNLLTCSVSGELGRLGEIVRRGGSGHVV